MMPCLKIFISIIVAIAAFASPSQAKEPQPAPFYKYSHNDAEYSVTLPEAPTVETIWAESKEIPYLESVPLEGAIGEIATFKRVDMETEDSFEVKVTFLKADPDFLASLTEKKMKKTLEKDFKGLRLDDQTFDFLTGTNSALKWAILTGFSVDKNNRPFYHAEHYLTGLQSILVVKVQYSVENQLFEQYYKKLADGITYHAP